MSKVAAAVIVIFALGGCGLMPTTVRPDPHAPSDEEAARTRARVHSDLASGYYELGNMAVALEEVQVALRADPNYGPAYNVAGLIYADLREDGLAQQYFERALRINPVDSDANNNYGRYLCDRKREAEGIKYFLAALRNPLYQNPDRSYVNAGLCARRRGDTPAAEEYFLKALQTRPSHSQALYQLADIAHARRAYTQAKDYLHKLAQVSGPSAEVLWLAVRVERRLGDRNAEESYASQLRRQFPKSKEAGALVAGRDE